MRYHGLRGGGEIMPASMETRAVACNCARRFTGAVHASLGAAASRLIALHPRAVSKKFRIAGINFDHFHMGDLLRMAHEHPDAELVAICDEQPERMREAQRNFSIPAERVFTDVDECMERARPDVVILCPAAAGHGEDIGRVAKYGVN